MNKAIHMMVRVFNLEKSMEFYQKVFNLTTSHKLEFDDFTLVYLRNEDNDFELELTWNKDQKEPYTHGDGYGHIAICVENLEEKHGQILSLGYQPKDIVEFKDEGKLLAKFFFIQDPDGYKIEVLQKHGHFK